jgi:hypothetical protein
LVGESEEGVEDLEGGTCSQVVVRRWKPARPLQLLLRGPLPQLSFAGVYGDLVNAVGVQHNNTCMERRSTCTAVADAMSKLDA